jgi:hypothetical protein
MHFCMQIVLVSLSIKRNKLTATHIPLELDTNKGKSFTWTSFENPTMEGFLRERSSIGFFLALIPIFLPHGTIMKCTYLELYCSTRI